MKAWPLGLRVGILGGGQLARMLAQSAQRMGLEVHVLCPSAAEPAAQVTGFHFQGSPDSPQDLAAFAQKVDVMTFESEFIDVDKLPKSGASFFPAPELMRLLQDRRTQKQLLVDAQIPTASFIVVDGTPDLRSAFQTFPKGFVLKKARGGYDGYGTFYVKTAADLARLEKEFPGPCIAEALVSFQRELAFMAVCGEKDFFFLPLVESRQTQSRCDWVRGPIRHRKLAALQKRVQKFLRKQNYRGVIAFELFDTGSELLVNEIAPRVHNSGHYSMDALTRSQFDLHWEAGLGLKLRAPTALAKGFAMANLLGASNQPFQFPPGLQSRLHWYGKQDNRPGRKMGHLNEVGPTPAAALQKVLRERKRVKA